MCILYPWVAELRIFSFVLMAELVCWPRDLLTRCSWIKDSFTHSFIKEACLGSVSRWTGSIIVFWKLNGSSSLSLGMVSIELAFGLFEFCWLREEFLSPSCTKIFSCKEYFFNLKEIKMLNFKMSDLFVYIHRVMLMVSDVSSCLMHVDEEVYWR